MLNGQTKSKRASIQSRISPNSERSVSAEAVGLLCLGSLKAIAQAAHCRDLDPAGLQLLAQAMDINLDGIVADFLAPAAEMIDQLILAHQPPHAGQQHLEQSNLTRREIKCLTTDLRHTPDLIVAE